MNNQLETLQRCARPPRQPGLEKKKTKKTNPEKIDSITAPFCPRQGVSMPIPVIGLLNEDKVFVNGSCVLNEERFMLIGSFVAFFIPLVIMVVTYCLTVKVGPLQTPYFFTANDSVTLCNRFTLLRISYTVINVLLGLTNLFSN